MFLIDSIHRAPVVGFFIAFVFAAPRVGAQVLDVPESTVVYMTSPALFQLVDPEIAAAALGRHHVITVEVPSGSRWARIASHLMTATNASSKRLGCLSGGVKGYSSRVRHACCQSRKRDTLPMS